MSSILNLRRKKNPSSNCDLSHVHRGTMMPGVVYPFFFDVVPGDTLSISPSVFIQALPLEAPLMGSFDICLEMFFAPDRLYQKDLFFNNAGATTDPSKVVFPSVTLPVNTDIGGTTANSLDFDNAFKEQYTVRPNSLADMMGFPVGMTAVWKSGMPSFSKLRAYSYVDIIRNYYANSQEGYVLSYDFSLSTPLLQTMFRDLDLVVNQSRGVDSTAPSSFMLDWRDLCVPYRRLFFRTLAPERLDTWLSTSQYDQNAGKVSVQVENNEVILTDARFGSHVLRYLELALAGGGRYDDFLGAQFDVRPPKDMSVPTFLGSMRDSLAFDKVMQTSSSTADSPLGNLAGEGAGGRKFTRRRFSFSEYGTFVTCLSLRPRVDYQLGIDPMLMKLNLESKYAPALDRIGFQPLTLAELNALPVLFDEQSSTPSGVNIRGAFVAETLKQAIGYQPAWSEYMSIPNRLHGLLTTKMRYWALTRRYSGEIVPDSWYKGTKPELFNDLRDVLYTQQTISSYVIPAHYNYAFADNSEKAENFVYQLALDVKCKREKSKVNMPNFV